MKDFRRKIVTPEQLRELIGPPPRPSKVVMCHGTFDIVHPGHLRHLMYAKEQGGVLVASLTCDSHISKANLRPFVPEQLRATNLAAYEFVDYVIIDGNQTPLENIRFLQPDLFAKGFDYFEGGIPEKTRAEMAVVQEYGGEMLFTPGDVMYSSSLLLEEPPDLRVAKLQVLMDSENVSFDLLRETLGKFAGRRVHVLGDTIVDSYTYCRVGGGTTKTPTLSTQFERQVRYAGGAAVVAKHLRQAGAEVILSTVLGDDELKGFVQDDLAQAGVECRALVDSTRPTTEKNSIICQGYHLMRMSRVDNRSISEAQRQQLSQELAGSLAQAYMFCDYRHGIFNRNTIPALSAALPAGALKAADSQVASRWGNILDFQGFDLITPNEREARFALGDQDSIVRPLAHQLFRQAHCKVLILTLGERGLLTYRARPENIQREFFTLDAFADRVVDAVGTGDALLAYATLGLLVTGSEVVASILGCLAAGVACEGEGNDPVDPQKVAAKIDSIERELNYR